MNASPLRQATTPNRLVRFDYQAGRLLRERQDQFAILQPALPTPRLRLLVQVDVAATLRGPDGASWQLSVERSQFLDVIA